MSVEKSEVLSAAMDAHAAELVKMRDGSHKRVSELEGVVSFLKRASANILQLQAIITADLKAEKLVVPADPMAYAKELLKWIHRCSGVTASMADNVTAEGLKVEGRILGLDLAIGVAHKKRDEELNKLAGALAPAPTADGPGADVIPLTRQVGQHPGQSEADLRKAGGPQEAQGEAEASSAQTHAPVEPAAQAAQEEAAGGKASPPPAARKRRRT